MWNEINETLLQALKDDDSVATQLPALERDVTAGSMAPGAAARRLVKAFRQRN
ncbi:MAG: LAO/AO transport system [Rhodospirillaceae bacterium]|nr:MAG: LAO/AO transport system [Rhodospirillaceae bacterium]